MRVLMLSYQPHFFMYINQGILSGNLMVLLFSFVLIIGCVSNNQKEDSTLGSVLKSINGEPVVPRSANRIIIPFFYNYTDEPSISERLTLKVREMISMDGRLAVVADNNDADIRLIGRIVHYRIQPIQYGNFGEPIRKRLRIVAAIRLLDLRKAREIFFEREIQSFKVYSDLIPPVESIVHVQDSVIDNLSRRISVKTISGWYTKLMTPVEKGN
ncbi:MAG: LPS assembly lipoprotein LptE [Spirochaetota bacterium]|nr:LPS assembly lipoprotein LptE [Spirochaetota bacterium]